MLAPNVHHYIKFGIIWVKFNTDTFFFRETAVCPSGLIFKLLHRQEKGKEWNPNPSAPSPPPQTPTEPVVKENNHLKLYIIKNTSLNISYKIGEILLEASFYFFLLPTELWQIGTWT